MSTIFVVQERDCDGDLDVILASKDKATLTSWVKKKNMQNEKEKRKNPYFHNVGYSIYEVKILE